MIIEQCIKEGCDREPINRDRYKSACCWNHTLWTIEVCDDCEKPHWSRFNCPCNKESES